MSPSALGHAAWLARCAMVVLLCASCSSPPARTSGTRDAPPAKAAPVDVDAKRVAELAAASGTPAFPPAPATPSAADGRAPVAPLVRHAVRLAGTPEEIGRQHGRILAEQIKTVLREYILGSDAWQHDRDRLLARVRVMKKSLPAWYVREIAACAAAAGVDEDTLLYTQCEGDVKSLPRCTTYVALPEATHDGQVEMGRNFDYWGLESTEECATVFAVVPERDDGYAFVSVGWAGILGGWTIVNERGLFVANNLGGGAAKNPAGIPTLILQRIVAQKAGSVAEAIGIIGRSPRMRGQCLVIGQAADAARGIPASAAAVSYDAERVDVRPATDGVAFHTSVGTVRGDLCAQLKRGRRSPIDPIRWAGNGITLHSVAVRPQQHLIWVAHGRPSFAYLGDYIEYDVRILLSRDGPPRDRVPGVVRFRGARRPPRRSNSP